MLRKSNCTALMAAAVLAVVLAGRATAVTVTIDNYLTEPNGVTAGAIGTFAVQSFTPTVAGLGINDTVAANLPFPTGLGLQSVSFLRAETGAATAGQLFIDVYQGAGDTGTYLGSSTNSIDVNSATALDVLTWNFPILFMDFTVEHALVWSTDANAGNTVGARLQVARDAGGGFGDSYSGGTADNNGDNGSPVAFDARFEVTMTDNLVDPGSITATIDRGSGSITLTNTTDTSLPNIVGYTILSTSGSLTQSGWDKQATGSQLANDNDQWTVLTGAGVTTDLAEAVIETTGDGNGGDLVATTGSWNFGNVWRKSHLEDLSMELSIDDGTLEGLILNSGTDFTIEYTGDPIDPADLDGNGTINPLDWVEFKNGYGTDVAGMTTFDAYHNSDINLDGVSNQLDFVAYRNLYNAAAGGGSLDLAGAAVPEPATWLLVLMGTLAMAFRRNRMTFQRQIRLAGLAVAAASSIFGSSASAQILVPIFADDFESYSIADPADFTTGADNWVHNGNGTAPNASRIFASGNFVPSGTTQLWIASAANAAAGSGINSNNGVVVDANTDYTFKAALVAETLDPNRTATGTYDLLIGSSLGAASSVIGGPQAFMARGDDAPGGESTYDDQFTTHAFNSGSVGVSDRLFISIAFNGTDASIPFVGIDEVSINALAEIGVNVNTSSGEVSFFGDPEFDFDITSYSLTSSLGQLVPGSLTSLESQGVGDPAMTPDDGIGFEVLSAPTDTEIAEADLTGSTTFDSSTTFSPGNIFDTSTLEGDRDLQITFTNVDGELLTGTVNYFEGGTVPGDYNGNGIVDAADYVRWRDSSGAGNESAFAPGTGNGGGVDATDYTFWKNRFGATSGSGGSSASASAVPEPSTAILALLGVAGAFGLAHRKKRKASGNARCFTLAVTSIVAGAVVGSSALATVRLDREYNMGDDGDTPTAVIGNTVGITWDNAGTPNTGDLQDLLAAGDPTYVNVSGRPQAGGSTIGVAFDGDGDALSGFLLNRPEQLKAIIDATGPTNPFPHNYDNLAGHGMQLWVNPAASALGSEGSPTTFQSIVSDTLLSGGPAINAVGQWTQINSQHIDGAGAVPATVDVAAGDTWYHVMHHHAPISGDQFRSVLYVDGIAVSANLDTIPFVNTEDFFAESVIVGARQLDVDGNETTIEFGNYFTGTIDDLEMYVYGDNTTSGGQNYGTFALFADNEWIAQEIIDTVPGQVLDPGDVNKDGNVDGGDVTAFLAGWRSENTLPGAHGAVRAGDWLTWDNGDMNHDGITDLRDARILHHGLLAAGAGGLDFSLLGGANVPEPSTCLLAIAGALAIGGYRRWKR